MCDLRISFGDEACFKAGSGFFRVFEFEGKLGSNDFSIARTKEEG